MPETPAPRPAPRPMPNHSVAENGMVKCNEPLPAAPGYYCQEWVWPEPRRVWFTVIPAGVHPGPHVIRWAWSR